MKRQRAGGCWGHLTLSALTTRKGKEEQEEQEEGVYKLWLLSLV